MPKTLSDFSAVVMLDIDGVLNDDVTLAEVTQRQINEGKNNWANSEDDDLFCKHCSEQIIPKFVNNLNYLIKAFNLGIVLSSTWRKYDLTRRAVTLANIYEYEERLMGITPELNTYRGREIEEWIKANNYNGEFIILDDDADMHPFMKHLVQTNWVNGGLDEQAMGRAIKYLESIVNK